MPSPVHSDTNKENLFIKDGRILQKILIEDIIWISSEGNYITIHTSGKRFVLKMSLRRVKEFLSENAFTQIHRNFIVQINCIDRIDTSSNSLNIADKELPIGRRFKSNLLNKLNLIQ